jgi:multiple sugar transport system ATP-binding protein
MARISLRDVEKWYGDTLVLRNCNLVIEDHEFVVLVGPSGSGKTTLLRIIAGLEPISGGEVHFDDVLVNDIDVADRDVAMVFQNYGLYPHMSVYENMAFGLRRRGLAKAEIDRRVRSTAAMLSVDPFLGRKPKQLSGGQRQRVAVGRAIVRDPAVFLLDEPLSNLDAHLRVQMRAEILKVHRQVTATTVYVTHDQVEALTMGDRIAVMHEGRIHQVGTPDRLYDAPVSKFVASFIGTPSMGFLVCDVPSSDHGQVLVCGTTRLSLDHGTARLVGGVRSGRVWAGVRPEHLAPGPEAPRPGRIALTGTVSLVEMLGPEQHVHVDVDGHELIARISREHAIKVQETVTLATEARHLHLFDYETGEALRAPASHGLAEVVRERDR